MVVSLRTALRIDEASTKEALLNFKRFVSPKEKGLEEENDVQVFLREKAIQNEISGKTATYLFFNDENNAVLDGYFSLALKTFEFCDAVSKTRRKRLSTDKDKEAKAVPAFLIGQLGRAEHTASGTGLKILKEAISQIKAIQLLIGGCCLAYIDCLDYMIDYYTKQNFIHLQKNPNNSKLNQMYIII